MALGSTKRQPYSNPLPAHQPQPALPHAETSTPPPGASQPAPDREPQKLSWVTKPKISAWVVLPLRLFLGCSFLAGCFDKLTDPTYLDPSAPSYIGAQIAAFAPGTPLEGFLLNFAVPNATLFGVLVMGGEFCIGIAVLLGLLTRFAAAMGLLLNLTFYLSATWNVHPFFLGSDLPYVFGWLTLLLAGPGLFALDHRLGEWWAPKPIVYPSEVRTLKVAGTATAANGAGTAMTRRAFLGAGGVGLVAFSMASAGVGWGLLNSGKKSAVASETRKSPVPAPTASAVARLDRLAGPNDLPVNQSRSFVLPTGEPAVLVHTDSGYSAYVAICTHKGCKVSYSPRYRIIGCPCHGAEFDAANNGQVLRGPALRPLTTVPLTVGPDGSVYLAG